MVRHMILNSVRMYRMMFTEEYNEVVLWDSDTTGEEVLSEYKLNRKMGRERWTRLGSTYGVLNRLKMRSD